MPADTAILLFANAAAQEVKHKVFTSRHGVRANEQVAQTLLNHTVAVAKQAQLPLIRIFSEQQSGRTFGERLANAFQDAFAAGYQRVICIGSDCPALQAADLQKASEMLRTQHMVIGPAADGGAYLIGMHIDCFNPEALAMLNWQTQEVQDELALYSFRQEGRLGCFGLLEVKADVDDSSALAHLLESPEVSHTLRKSLLAILLKSETKPLLLRRLLLKPLQLYLQKLLLRAPPLS